MAVFTAEYLSHSEPARPGPRHIQADSQRNGAPNNWGMKTTFPALEASDRRCRTPCFSRTEYQIICVDNSYAPYSQDQPMWQGTPHTATILTPNESKRRVINSTLIASAPAGTRGYDRRVATTEVHHYVNRASTGLRQTAPRRRHMAIKLLTSRGQNPRALFK